MALEVGGTGPARCSRPRIPEGLTKYLDRPRLEIRARSIDPLRSVAPRRHLCTENRRLIAVAAVADDADAETRWMMRSRDPVAVVGRRCCSVVAADGRPDSRSVDHGEWWEESAVKVRDSEWSEGTG